MKQYNVTGMSCTACQTRVEKAVNSIDGVTSCAVSLLTNSMGVEGDVSDDVIIKAVEAAGYGASLKTSSKNTKQDTDPLKDLETPKMKKRLIASVILLIPLMYVSMGHMMFNWPLPSFLKGNHIGIGIYELIISALIMVINQKFFINGFKGLINKSPNMDTLVALGATASFSYSVFALFMMSYALTYNQLEQVIYYTDQFYFESAATILTLITVGKMLESISKGKTTNALKSLMNLAPKTATILEDNIEKEVSIEEVKVNDLFVVRPGDSIPVDGVVIKGESSINEAALTGESVPVDKELGDKVSAATINTSGYLVCRAERVGEDTTLAGIIKMVSDAAATKAPIAKIADKVSGVFVPVVMGIALFTLIIWLLVGESFGYAIARAVSVLVISCPCALGLATPVAIMVGNGVAAKSGILFKTAASLEQTGKVQIVVLDKTGTITTGLMKVTDVIVLEDTTNDELIELAYALEIKSEHPISRAIVDYAILNDVKLIETSNFETFAGKGISAKVNDDLVIAGNYSFIKSKTTINSKTNSLVDSLAKEGKTPIFLVKNNRVLGIIAVSDTIKEDSPKAIKELKNMGLHVVMLTGDNLLTAKAIAEKISVDEVIAEVKPDGKEAVIKELMAYGKVMMVGDGINDAPALTRADVGVAIGAGVDIAIDAADIVLMKSSIEDVAAAIRISRRTIKNIHENLFWAFFYNVIGIPLAAGLYVKLLGLTLNPMFGAAAMGLSSFCVVTNALRLNLIKVYDLKKDKKLKNSINGVLIHNEQLEKREEDNKMKITINGMMCGHCEAHVKKALEAIEGIESVTASHETNSVTIETSKTVDESLIKAAVEAEGYEYVGVVNN